MVSATQGLARQKAGDTVRERGHRQDTGARGMRRRLMELHFRSRRRRPAQKNNGTGAGGMVRGEGSAKIRGVLARGRRRMECGESTSNTGMANHGLEQP